MRETEPIKLGEQDNTTFELTMDRVIDEVLAFCVWDVSGKAYWHYPRLRLFERLRLSLRQWKQMP